MKKLLTLSLLFASAIIFIPPVEAKTAESNNISAGGELNAAPQIYQRRYRRPRVVNRVRIVRRGYRTYREVWQYRYFRNGRVTTRLISRTRIR
jgi:hypothetical protein